MLGFVTRIGVRGEFSSGGVKFADHPLDKLATESSGGKLGKHHGDSRRKTACVTGGAKHHR
jgi:hypothetical protein